MRPAMTIVIGFGVLTLTGIGSVQGQARLSAIQATGNAPSAEAGLRAPADPGAEGLPRLEPGTDFHVGDPALGHYLEILLRDNPEILAARRDWRAAREKPAQVRSLPDPQLNMRYFVEPIETRVGPQNAALEVAQPVPWLSKLSTDGRRAEKLAEGLRDSIRELERSRIRDFKVAYYDLAYFDEALRVNREEQGLLRRFEQTALTRYSTGEGVQQNVIKVQTEITRLIDQETRLEERRAVLRRRLAQLLGRPDGAIDTDPIVLPDPEVRFDPEALEAAALRYRPGLRAMQDRVEAAGLLVERRRLEWRPDFQFGVTYTDVDRQEDLPGGPAPPPDNGQDAVSLMAGIRIPLYKKRIVSGVREARELQEADLGRLQSERDQVLYELQDAVLRLESLLERTALYRDTLIPQAEQSLSTSEAAYQNNEIPFLDLIDAERVWFQVRLAHRRLLGDAWKAMADVERAMGKKFPAAEATESLP